MSKVVETGAARILIALCGLLRSYRVTWPVLADQLRLDWIEATQRARVDVIVLTSLQRTCLTIDEQRYGACPPRLMSNLSTDERRQEIRATIGSRLRLIHDEELSSRQRAFGFSLEARVHGFVRHLVRTDVMQRPSEFRSRLSDDRFAMELSPREREAAAARAFFDPYSVIFMVRPDVVLVPPVPLAYERAMSPFDLLRSSEAFPGFQVISGSIWRASWYHNRDYDLAHMLSSPARVSDWLGLEAKLANTCSAYPGCALIPPVPPPRPPGLSGAWSSNLSRAGTPSLRAYRPKENLCTLHAKELCNRVVYFANRRLPMGALPEALAVAHIVRLAADVDATGEITPCVIGALDDDCGVLCARRTNPEMACRSYVPAVLVGRAPPLELRSNASVAAPFRRQTSPGTAHHGRRACAGVTQLGRRAFANFELDRREYAC